MEHDLQVRILKELLQQLDTGKNVDAGVQYKMGTEVYLLGDSCTRARSTVFRTPSAHRVVG